MFSFRRWLSTTAAPVLGMDIAEQGVRLIEIEQRGHNIRIAHQAESDWPQEAMTDSEGRPSLGRIQALRHAYESSGSRQRSVTLALSSGSVIKKILSLPRPSHDEELEILVEDEAAQSLPFARDEMSLDFSIVGPTPNAPDRVDVLLVAARKEPIDQRVALVEAIGLKVQIVDVEAHAIALALVVMQSATVHPLDAALAEGIIYSSADGLHALVVREGQVLFERSLSLARPAPDSAGSPEAMAQFSEALCQEWHRTSQLFAASSGGVTLHRLHLVGLGSSVDPIARALDQQMGVQTSIPDPFSIWASKPNHSRAAPPTQGADYVIACGLALRGLKR
jgi:type IV pilus assembly protein PilM